MVLTGSHHTDAPHPALNLVTMPRTVARFSGKVPRASVALARPVSNA